MPPGFRCPITTRFRHEIWVKLLGNVAFNPISALTGGTLEELARHPDVSGVVRMLMAETEAVSPLARHSAMVSRTAWSKRSSDGTGTRPRMTSWARSIRIPVGSPRASLAMSPPGGSAEWGVMPARVSARPLAQVACPSTRMSATGCPGAARSSEARDG